MDGMIGVGGGQTFCLVSMTLHDTFYPAHAAMMIGVVVMGSDGITADLMCGWFEFGAMCRGMEQYRGEQCNPRARP